MIGGPSDFLPRKNTWITKNVSWIHGFLIKLSDYFNQEAKKSGQGFGIFLGFEGL